MWAPLAACHKLALGYNRLLMVLCVFDHKMQHILIHATYARIVVFWHMSNIPLRIKLNLL